MSRQRRAPRNAASSIRDLADRLAPATALAQIQRHWPAAVGEAVAAQATPTGEAGGVLTVTCKSAVWAQEIDLMSVTLIASLNSALGSDQVVSLRCQTVAAKGWSHESAQ
jgi:predicted nucleic acid-binding Zn ribbon protein